MVNEFAYCPRLFFYEWVDGLFQESADTVEGAIQHKRVDEKATALPAPADLPESIHSRVGDAGERAAAGDRQDGPGGGGRRRRHAGGLQARPSARGRGRAGTLAVGPRATGGAGAGAAGERVPRARKAWSITARRGSGSAWRSTRR